MASDRDLELMRIALAEAEGAAAGGDVPVGAVVARGDEVLARAGNARERDGDATAHAEILAIGAASDARESWRLNECICT